MDVVVRGRHCEVTDRFQRHVREKLVRLDKHDAKAFRVDVELGHESNPRLSDSCDRIELTLHSRGPVVRAEASASDKYAALDLAVGKLEERLRRAADRRHGHHSGHHGGHQAGHRNGHQTVTPSPDPVEASLGGTGTATLPGAATTGTTGTMAPTTVPSALPEADDDVVLAAGPLVVREKTHDGGPLSLEDALHRMELVGHDFYLFCDVATGAPSVVYRRRGWTYGVLRLQQQ